MLQHRAGFIVSTNIAPRNLNNGQQAILLAKIYPEPAKVGRGEKGSEIEPFMVHKGALGFPAVYQFLPLRQFVDLQHDREIFLP
jgi:hypothetical protein